MPVQIPDQREFDIRLGTKDDLDDLVAYYRELCRSDLPFIPQPSEGADLATWLHRAGYSDFDRNYQWLILHEDRMIGLISAQRRDNPAIGLVGIVAVYMTILSEFRSRGVGTALIPYWAT